MKLSGALEGEPAGLLKDLLEPKTNTMLDLWQQARRTGKLKLGNVILAERQQSSWRYKLEIHRLREIEAVVVDNRRWGVVSDVNILTAISKSMTGQRLADWCGVFAPEVSENEIAAAEASAIGRRRMLSADDCAALLGVTMEQRQRLGLRTIGATDMAKAERQAFMREVKRERDRERQTAKRVADGHKPQLDSITRAKPWEALQMTRATWYRKGKPSLETTSSPIGEVLKITEGDKPVSLPDLPTSKAIAMPDRAIVPALPAVGTATTDKARLLQAGQGARGDQSPRIPSIRGASK